MPKQLATNVNIYYLSQPHYTLRYVHLLKKGEKNDQRAYDDFPHDSKN